jgi:nitrogen regulatory protein PII
MFSKRHAYSTVTAILPKASTDSVIPAILQDPGTSALVWNARGTLLHDHWWKQWFPPISPGKTMLQVIVPDADVARIVSTVVETGRLHQQATGAVYSTPCEHAYFGSDFHNWPTREGASLISGEDDHKLTENLSIIYCIVGHEMSDRVSKAATNAGAHGPVVYYTEGRGLRDRLGWLRITKQHEKELMMVITDATDAEEVFDAMAHAGDLHLPGKGFMYRLNIDRGMFNLPSRVSHHHYDANMQQIINAIDRLSGHNHWRDQSVFSVGGQGRGIGLETLRQNNPVLEDQVCLSALATREQCPVVMDMLLDAGAPGLNVNYANFTTGVAGVSMAGARINEEYGMLRCITSAEIATGVCALVERDAEQKGVTDLCMTVNSVPSVATYVPGSQDYRAQPTLAFAS